MSALLFTQDVACDTCLRKIQQITIHIAYDRVVEEHEIAAFRFRF
jgi:hypothetical protein